MAEPHKQPPQRARKLQAEPPPFAARAETALRGGGGRMTRSRRALIELLAAQPGPLEPREVQEELRKRGAPMDRVSVYRNLATLVERGVLHRVLGTSAVRPCADASAACHHAMVCTRCGSAREFDCAPVVAALEEIRRALRFKLHGHLLELRGTCPRCAKGA